MQPVTVQLAETRESVTAVVYGPGTMPRQLGSLYSALHLAGFESVVTPDGLYHRLPAEMDRIEHRAAVTHAVDRLQAEGYHCVGHERLTAPAHPKSPSRSLTGLPEAIKHARHTDEVAASLSLLTTPGHGVLDQAIDALTDSATWREQLGSTASDPHYAARLRYITDRLDGRSVHRAATSPNATPATPRSPLLSATRQAPRRTARP
ncbi:hypothetical protein [Kitasatospora sp. LaBMicrA B282]|uniref:hypothetical protein n=1 Tax=Kitasatospora sp. LaBMicrA B282 TaxID=3420949 RepID=UPI003D0AE65F